MPESYSIVKEGMKDLAMEIFKDRGVMISTKDKTYSRAVTGSPEFMSTYMKNLAD